MEWTVRASSGDTNHMIVCMSDRSTSFMQYMRINRKEDQLDNNWINFRNLDDLANDLVADNVYRKGFDLINCNNINNYSHCNENYYYNYNNDKKRVNVVNVIDGSGEDETKIAHLEAI